MCRSWASREYAAPGLGVALPSAAAPRFLHQAADPMGQQTPPWCGKGVSKNDGCRAGMPRGSRRRRLSRKELRVTTTMMVDMVDDQMALHNKTDASQAASDSAREEPVEQTSTTRETQGDTLTRV
ncbi:hypothetical protein N9L68_00580 [bacterium]|nr:hypothetical protein [bacterium]